MKKIISLILAILMIISAMTTVSYAEDKQSYVDLIDFKASIVSKYVIVLFNPIEKTPQTTIEDMRVLGAKSKEEEAEKINKLLSDIGSNLVYEADPKDNLLYYFFDLPVSAHIAYVETKSQETGSAEFVKYNDYPKYLDGIQSIEKDKDGFDVETGNPDDFPDGTLICPAFFLRLSENEYSLAEMAKEMRKFDGCEDVHFVMPTTKWNFLQISNGEIIKEFWYKESVRYCLTYELMSGMKPAALNTGYMVAFEPETAVTRAMAVKTLHNIEGMPKATADAPVFSDAASGWYADAVKWASEKEITNGISKDLFAPGKAITREQFAVFLYRYAALKGYDTKGKSDLSKFNDNADVSDYAKAALEWANHEEYITGMGNGMLAPQGQLTRAQLASILMRFTKAHKE